MVGVGPGLVCLGREPNLALGAGKVENRGGVRESPVKRGPQIANTHRIPIAVTAILTALGCGISPGAQDAPGTKTLILAHFLGPLHPMSAAVFAPFAERLEEHSRGRLTVKEFPGGALNSSPRRQYSILVDGVADIAFAMPGYTSDLFPKTNLISFPGVCQTATDCTEALQRARPVLEREYRAKVLAIWSSAAPGLLTRDKPVRTLQDMQGLKIRVSSRLQVPFIEALGASALMQPIPVVHQNLTNGVIDGVVIALSGIAAYQLQEPADYFTTGLPLSGTPFVLLMNQGVYAALSAEERGWVDAAADASLSARGAAGYERAQARGLRIIEEAGVEIVDLPEGEKRRFERAIADTYEAALSRGAGDMTVGEVIGYFGKK